MSQADQQQDNIHDAWLDQAIEELRRPVAPSVAGQLRAARRQALSLQYEKQPDRKQPPWFRMNYWPAAALASLSALMLAVFLWDMSESDSLDKTQIAQLGDSISSEDLAIINAQDDLQFYQDLEFLLWLENEIDDATQS